MVAKLKVRFYLQQLPCVCCDVEKKNLRIRTFKDHFVIPTFRVDSKNGKISALALTVTELWTICRFETGLELVWSFECIEVDFGDRSRSLHSPLTFLVYLALL